MSWLRVDDGFTEHEKCVGLSDLAYALWLKAGCWCAKSSNLKLRGFIPRVVAMSLLRSGPEAAEAAASELVEAVGLPCFGHEHGLWEIASGGWQFHNWEKYRPATSARFEAGSVAASAAGRVGGKVSARKRKEKYGSAQPRSGAEADPEAGSEAQPSNASRSGLEAGRAEARDPDPDPDPRSDLSSPTETRRVDTRRQTEQVFKHWQSVHGHPRAKLDQKRRARIAARLRDFSVDQLCAALTNAKRDPFLMGDDPRAGRTFDGIETLLRDTAQVERLLELDGSRRQAPGRVQHETTKAAIAKQMAEDRAFRKRHGGGEQSVDALLTDIGKPLRTKPDDWGKRSPRTSAELDAELEKS